MLVFPVISFTPFLISNAHFNRQKNYKINSTLKIYQTTQTNL
jgi:hypothetical protein